MKRPTKVLLGVATLAALAWSIYAVIVLSRLMLPMLRSGHVTAAWLDAFGAEVPGQVLGAVLMLAVLAIYLVHCGRNRHLRQGSRATWMVALAIGGTFVMPVYFVLHIWPDREPPPLPPRRS